MSPIDLYAALEWTQREIDVFGGDPKRVTIYGHSSGGSIVDAVCLLLPDGVAACCEPCDRGSLLAARRPESHPRARPVRPFSKFVSFFLSILSARNVKPSVHLAIEVGCLAADAIDVDSLYPFDVTFSLEFHLKEKCRRQKKEK